MYWLGRYAAGLGRGLDLLKKAITVAEASRSDGVLALALAELIRRQDPLDAVTGSRLLERAERALARAGTPPGAMLDVRAAKARHWAKTGKAKQAITLLQKVIEEYDPLQGPSRNAILHNALAVAYAKTGNYAEAIDATKRRIALLEQGLGKRQPVLHHAYARLAEYLQLAGDPAGALVPLAHKLKLLTEAHGPAHPFVIDYKRQLVFHQALGRQYSAAIRRHRSLPPDEQLASWRNVLPAYAALGQWAEAIAVWKRLSRRDLSPGARRLLDTCLATHLAKAKQLARVPALVPPTKGEQCAAGLR